MTKVLFIGNSHTYFECLPWVFTAICKQAGIDVHAGMSTYPGCTWEWHLASACTMSNLWHGNYDYVVIQQKSHPFDGEESLVEQGALLIKEINKVNAKPVLFNTWSEKDNPSGQKLIDDAFGYLYTLNKSCLIARCGAAWHSLRGIVDLYAEDGEHQNSYGAYLNACVLAKSIFSIDLMNLSDEVDSMSLPETIVTKPVKIKLSKSIVRLLHEAASKV